MHNAFRDPIAPNPRAALNRTHRNRTKVITVVFCLVVLPALLLFLAMRPAIAASPKPYNELQFAPLPPLKLPPYEQFTLGNGMKVFLMENHDLPLVEGSLLIKTGSRDERTAQTGLASITGSVMRSGGTTQHAANVLNELLEQKAASIESGVGVNSGSVGFSSLTEDLPTVFDLFSEVVQSPVLPQDKIDLAKFQARGGIARRNDQAGSIMSREFRKLIYGEASPYARTVELTTIDAIQQLDIRKFYQTAFRPENFILGITGDINPRQMRSAIEARFANWKPTPAVDNSSSKSVAPIISKNPGIYIVNKSDLTQSSIQMGHLGGKVSDPDYPALSVMNEILSGFGGRLFNEIRSRQGLAYSVYAAWGPQFDYPGIFVAGGDTKSESTVPFIQSVRAEIDRIRTQPVSAQELKRAKDSVENSFIFNFDSPGKVLGRLLKYEYFGYPKDYLFQYQKAVAAISIEDIQRAAMKNLQPDRIVTMIVGNTANIKPPLSNLNQTVTPIDITVPKAS